MENLEKNSQQLAGSEKMQPSLKSVEIVVENDLTLAQLRKLAASNYITFTPHLGNKWREDLYLLNEQDLHVPNFERNASKLDVLDQPEKIKFQGEIFQLSDDRSQGLSIMTPYLQLSDKLPAVVRELISALESKNPGQLHQRATKAALPSSKLSLSGESFFLGEENALLCDLINAVHQKLLSQGQKHYKIFNRYVDSQGRFFYLKKNPETMEEVEQYEFQASQDYSSELSGEASHSFENDDLSNLPEKFFQLSSKLIESIQFGQLPPETEGPLPRNELMTLLLGLKPLLLQKDRPQLDAQGKFHAYAVSGPSMINYVNAKAFKTALDKLYNLFKEVAAERFNLALPSHLVMHFIPGASLSYLPVQDEASAISALNRFGESEASYRELQTQMKAQKGSSQLAAIAQEIRKKNQDAVADLAEATYDLPHVSQYDLLMGKKLLDKSQLAVIENVSFKQHQNISNLRDRVRQQGLNLLDSLRDRNKK